MIIKKFMLSVICIVESITVSNRNKVFLATYNFGRAHPSHYCGRHRFYWALVNFAIWIGWSAPNNNPNNYYVKAETMHGNP